MRALENIWWRKDERWWAEIFLWPLSLLSLFFRYAAQARRNATRPQQARARVISVGNLAVGGAGKTPVAMLLCELLRGRGNRPALLSRGYGRTSREEISIVCAGDGPLVDAQVSGDEPLAIARRCPWLTVLVGSDRARLALQAESMGADVLVLDDGLQQQSLACDLEVIVVDKKNPLGNGRRLPRGPLREGTEAFARVGSRGLLWLTNADRAGAAVGPAPRKLAALIADASAAGMRGPIETATIARVLSFTQSSPLMVGTPTMLLAGIARPERFEETAREIGLNIRGRAFFADHHFFSALQLAHVRRAARIAEARLIVTTEKDAARIHPVELEREPRIVPLPVDLELASGGEHLQAALDALLS